MTDLNLIQKYQIALEEYEDAENNALCALVKFETDKSPDAKFLVDSTRAYADKMFKIFSDLRDLKNKS